MATLVLTFLLTNDCGAAKPKDVEKSAFEALMFPIFDADFADILVHRSVDTKVPIIIEESPRLCFIDGSPHVKKNTTHVGEMCVRDCH